MDSTLAYAGTSWKFDTPRGKRTVRGKSENPLWIPPDWHYAEVAKENHLALSRVPLKGSGEDRERPQAPGAQRRGRHHRPRLRVEALPLDEEVVFDDTLYMPPLGSKNRRIYGELGSYRLDLGDGYLIHGTPEESTVGDAVTHGCVRLKEEDIAWLYTNVPDRDERVHLLVVGVVVGASTSSASATRPDSSAAAPSPRCGRSPPSRFPPDASPRRTATRPSSACAQ